MATLKELANKGQFGLAPGHRMCPGCPVPVMVKILDMAAKELGLKYVVANATGCLEVTSTIYPYSAWRVPWIHNAFENAASTIAGVEAMYKALKRKGKIKEDIKFVAIGGDGGSYDIGLQAMSGMFERWHNVLFITYDNEGYQNTGNQRSGATPRHGYSTTTPAGKVVKGKREKRKPLTEICAAHQIPYAAQGVVSNYADLMKKFKKALTTEGPTFINVLIPCTTGWGFSPNMAIEYSKLAVETCFWPLYEIENAPHGEEVVKVNYVPRKRKKLEEFLKGQARFAHLLKPEGEEALKKLKEDVTDDWVRLLKRAGIYDSLKKEQIYEVD